MKAQVCSQLWRWLRLQKLFLFVLFCFILFFGVCLFLSFDQQFKGQLLKDSIACINQQFNPGEIYIHFLKL
jgi:hypothetical protein